MNIQSIALLSAHALTIIFMYILYNSLVSEIEHLHDHIKDIEKACRDQLNVFACDTIQYVKEALAVRDHPKRKPGRPRKNKKE